MSDKNLVFVYGSLKQGHWNGRLLAGSRLLGPAETLMRMYMQQHRNGGFPYAVRSGRGDGRRPLRGEVYEVDAETLTRLDRLEGVPHHYQRTRVAVAIGDDLR